MRQTGLVLQYRANVGYGFIKTPTGQSLLFHIRQVRDGFLLEAGDTVAFSIGPSVKQAGKSECFDVELLSRAAVQA
jgi:cold shock CspA family protein